MKDAGLFLGFAILFVMLSFLPGKGFGHEIANIICWSWAVISFVMSAQFYFKSRKKVKKHEI